MLTRVLQTYLKILKQYQFSYDLSALQLYPCVLSDLKKIFDEKFSQEGSKEKSLDLSFVSNKEQRYLFEAMLTLIQATVRTSVYQNLESHTVVLKLAVKSIPFAPYPRPLYEIFIDDPIMEGCHVRGGRIARGGIRWSERYNDYRNEILDLYQTQTMKNSIIVPVGAKGGFISHRFSELSKIDPIQAKKEVISCYKLMIRSLLSVTDNIVDGCVVHPQNTVCYDGDDPYLVVAADKGTSTFSDYANEISQENGFWLKDAFASGGSHGYNHKNLGITAKGAWVSVQHHFKYKGIDLQNPFSVVGVGDMSGDVFGNGMLMSQNIILKAAFNHQYIFLDPNPDPVQSFEERKRLFQKPGSTWGDYRCLSRGGKIFERSTSSMSLSQEIQDALSISDDVISPNKLIQSILKAPVDLLWFGGIGTFVKASFESQDNAHDHGDDLVRVNACDIQAKVIAEGANLAMTHLARVEYSRFGGRLNSDAIDNSAGVDCSDHEVNLKILLGLENIDLEMRDWWLREVQKEVEDLVFEHNRKQNEILSHYTCNADSYVQTLDLLKQDLDITGFPQDFFHLTRPEAATILAYVKLLTRKEILNQIHLFSDQEDFLFSYFPIKMRERFKDSILKHPLRQEILATQLSSEIVNALGPFFRISDIVENISIIKKYINLKHI